ncbi:hypothetical protein PIB30_030585 [Stylosanthes scabra]|uniref:Uncharacterized protein n=1 Tax=Stylosanthes scabra TaxID=79078 RepID=A0ABU6UBZ3_9FABA|nr:hypothetical protein [Stylosanthes scabra]
MSPTRCQSTARIIKNRNMNSRGNALRAKQKELMKKIKKENKVQTMCLKQWLRERSRVQRMRKLGMKMRTRVHVKQALYETRANEELRGAGAERTRGKKGFKISRSRSD